MTWRETRAAGGTMKLPTPPNKDVCIRVFVSWNRGWFSRRSSKRERYCRCVSWRDKGKNAPGKKRRVAVDVVVQEERAASFPVM